MSTSRSALEDGLFDADFPASKQQLVDRAQRNNADADTLAELSGMPPVRYERLADVLASVRLDDDSDSTSAFDSPNPIVQELGENRGS